MTLDLERLINGIENHDHVKYYYGDIKRDVIQALKRLQAIDEHSECGPDIDVSVVDEDVIPGIVDKLEDLIDNHLDSDLGNSLNEIRDDLEKLQDEIEQVNSENCDIESSVQEQWYELIKGE